MPRPHLIDIRGRTLAGVSAPLLIDRVGKARKHSNDRTVGAHGCMTKTIQFGSSKYV